MNTAGGHLVIGGDGQLGRALVQRLHETGQPVVATTRRNDSPASANRHLNLSQPEAVSGFAWPDGVSRVYLLAAVTSLKACRQSPDTSRFINVTQAVRLAGRAAHNGATPVLVSTNLVFDGHTPRRGTADPPCPTSAYGEHKAEAEAAVLEHGGVVVRPTKVLPNAPPLLARWRDALRQGERVEAFSDLWFAPVPMGSVLDAVITAPPGVTHVSAERDVSYAEVARHIAHRVGATQDLVVETSAADAGTPPEERPRHTTLACEAPLNPLDVIDAALNLGHFDRRP